MLRRKGLILVALSLIMGVAAAYAANRWVAAQADSESANNARVVVAAMSIPYGTKVESRHLRYIEMPIDAAPADAFSSTEDVEGMVSRTDVGRGEILITERFAEHAAGSTLAALVSSNMRAMTVRVNDVIGVAGFLLPGNRVDVVSSRRDGNRRAVTETILRNLKVLAVDQTASTEENEPVIVRAVTLEMTPEQAEILVKARTEGEIQLTLRNPLEQYAEEVPEPEPEPVPESKPVVVQQAPSRPVNRATTVEVIRGTKVDKTKTKT